MELTNNFCTIQNKKVPGGSLSDILKKFGKLDVYITARYTKQMLLGLKYLHQNDVIHLDIKPGNVLIDNLGRYLASFCLCSPVFPVSCAHHLWILMLLCFFSIFFFVFLFPSIFPYVFLCLLLFISSSFFFSFLSNNL